VTLAWALGAVVIAAASFVMGLAGFGIALVALAFLPYLMSPADAIVLTTLYAAVFALAIFVPVRRDFTPARVADLIVGTVAGTPLGVWALTSFPASVLNRLIGLMLLVAVALEWRGLSPERLAGRGWGLGAGVPFENIKGRALFVWMSFGPGGGIAQDRIFVNVMGRPKLPGNLPDKDRAPLQANLDKCLRERPTVAETTPSTNR